MGKLTAIKTKSIFQSLLNDSKISEQAIHFILDTGLIYTHGIYINGAAYGTEANGAINLSIAGVTKALSLSTHTHSNYLEKNSNIDIGSYIIKSGNNELLKWASSKLILGSPTYITGTAHTTRNSTNYDILDTGNFSVVAKTSTNVSLQNVATIKYGSSTFLIDYAKRINGAYTFDNITYTSIGTTNVNNQQYGIITMYTDGSTPASYALIRADIPNGKLEYRTSGSTAWKTIVTGALPTVFVGSGSNHASGLVPDPGATAGTAKFLCEDGTWKTPTYTSDTNTWRSILVNGTLKLSTAINSGGLDIINGTNTTVEWTSSNKLKINSVNTWTAFVGASADSAGTAGYVSAPGKGNQGKYFRGDGTWATPTNTWNAANTSQAGYIPKLATGGGTIATQASEYVLVYVSSASGTVTPTWKLLPANAFKNDNTWKAANASQEGYVPKSTANKILRADANGALYWGDDANTTYSFSNLLFLQTSGTNLMTYNSQAVRTILAGSNITFTHSNNVLTITAKDTTYSTVSKSAAGLCPTLPNETTTTKYLRLDGTWVTPPDNNTWNANAVGVAGYVAAPTKAANANMTWQTDADGNPAWRASNNHSHSYLPLSGGTMTGGITCTTSGANLKWGNITIYGGGSNGGSNSIYIGDDVTLGDCNVSGSFGMKSTGANAGLRFFNSSGTSIGGIQSTAGTLQWINSAGTAYNILDASNSSVSLSGSTLSVKINGTTQSLTNTWRGMLNNLTTSSSSTSDSLSAYLGYLLANGSARDNTKIPLYRYGGTGSTTKIKININSTTSWMLCFVVTLYQGYRATKIMISGYLYGSSHWYQPEACLLGDSDNIETINVYFGYDDTNKLWVGFDGDSYTGVSINDVTNGYSQIDNFMNLFTISNVSSLTTLQKTVTAESKANYANSAGSVAWANVTSKPTATGDATTPVYWNGSGFTNCTAYANASVASAGKLTTSRTIWGQSFDGSANIDGILTGWTGCAVDTTDAWSDGTNSHPWYGIDHRYHNTGVYSTTITDYYGLTLKTNSGNISMTSGGYVGIGTTSPSYKLHVNGSINGTSIYLNGTALSTASTHAHGDYVTAIGTSGNTLTWSKGGTAQTAITVPYATNAGSASISSLLKGLDNRTTNNAPSWYMRNAGSASIYTEFCQTGGATIDFENRVTFTPWRDNSGQRPVQLAFNNHGMFIRTSESDTAWNGWRTIIHTGNIGSYITSGGGYNGGNITGTFSSSNGVPLQFTGVGSGTYNVCKWYCNNDGITLETPRATDSAGATSLPFIVKTRGGQYGTLKAGDVWVEGTLYVKEGYGIESRPSGDGLLAYHPYSYTGVASSQWGVGAASCQGVIRSSNSDLIHYRYGADAYTIWDSYNFNPSNYLAKNGGTMSGAIKFRNDRTGIYDLGAGGSTPSGYTTTNDGGNQIIGLISWDGASDEGGILVGSDCCIIYNSSDSGYLLKVIDKDVSSALGNGFGLSNVRFAITDGGECKIFSNCYASNFYTTSDIRKKDNIKPISNLIPIYEFNWKSDGSKSYGFIAQWLEQTNPELVSGEDYKHVNYSATLALYLAKLSNIVEETKEDLYAKISKLEARIKELETSNKLGGR